MHKVEIVSYNSAYKEQIISLTVDAWKPVFEKTRFDVPGFVYNAFYPDGWQKRQIQDVTHFIEQQPETFRLAIIDEVLVGYVGLQVHPEDMMGEVYIIAVSPSFQRQGIGRQLINFAFDHFNSVGMKMVMVETIGDQGHAPARHTYEAMGFKPWPVARYFKEL